jgi:hypothetical protein
MRVNEFIEEGMAARVDAVLNTPALGSSLIAELRAMCPQLPEAGIVAGQAVASLLLKRIGRAGPVNDIDVFIIQPLEWSEQRQRRAERLYAPVGETGRTTAPGYYAETLVNSHRRFMCRIGEVTRDGLLNRIEYQMEPEQTETLPDGDVLSLVAGNFDLNCVQVGIDLGTGRLSFTDAFRHYLYSNRLFITNGKSPISSLARLIRKTEELDAQCDLDVEGRFAAACMLLFGGEGVGCEATDYVGEQTYKKLLAQLPVLERWLHLAPLSALPRDHGELSSEDRAKSAFRLYKGYVASGLAAELMARPSLCPSVVAERCGGNTITRVEGESLGQMEFSVIDRLFREGALSRRKLAKLLTVFAHGERGVLSACLVNPLRYVHDNVTRQSVEEMNRFFREHPGIVRNLIGISHAEQVRIKRALKGRERRGDGWAIGAVEYAHAWLDEPVGPCIVRDGMDAFLERYSEVAKVPIEARLPEGVERIPLFEVRQLNTAAALYAEGQAMGHCVGGYAPLLAEAGNHFFSVQFRMGRKRSHRSTLHVTVAAGLVRNQHLSVRNTLPSTINRIAGELLVERLRRLADGGEWSDWRAEAVVLWRELRSGVRRWLRPLLQRRRWARRGRVIEF